LRSGSACLSGQGVNVAGRHRSCAGAQDAAVERGVLIVLDGPPPPVWYGDPRRCQGCGAGSAGQVAAANASLWQLFHGDAAPDAKVILYSDSGHGFLFQHAEDLGHEVLNFLR